MRILLFPLSIIVFDQTLKFLAQKNLLPPLGDFFATISCNSGIAFGIALPRLAFILLWSLSIVAILYLLRLEKKNLPLLLILGGALSNILDRIFQGCVIDYISFLNIPTFNLADTAICLGITWFTIATLFKK